MVDNAAVVGAGPNGLAAAVTLARAGVPVTVFETADTIGGGTRTRELVAPGVLHDVCSAIHPMALATGFFRAFELTRRMDFAVPVASYANPLDDGPGRAAARGAGRPAAIAYRDLGRTVAELGVDGPSYARYYRPLLEHLEEVLDFGLGGSMLRIPGTGPGPAHLRLPGTEGSDPSAGGGLGAAVANLGSGIRGAAAGTLATGLRALEQGTYLWNLRFAEDAAPALISGVAAHSIGTMPSLATAAVGVMLGALGHASGWPVPIGGSRAITDALAADLLAHGGVIETGHQVTGLDELAGFHVKVFDTSAAGLEAIAGDALPAGYRRALRRQRFGNGATKVDFVLDGPIPWADERVHQAPTVHLGGTRAEAATAERTVARGRHPGRPYVLLAQPTAFDPGRNPAGVHAVWSYTHVPAGSMVDVSRQVVAQIERFAPGFTDRIVDMRVTTAAELEAYNENYVGGDFSAGAVTMRQLLARPVLSGDPWRIPARGGGLGASSGAGIYLGSSATPPGPGVTGLPGWYAALSALEHDYHLPTPHLGL